MEEQQQHEVTHISSEKKPRPLDNENYTDVQIPERRGELESTPFVNSTAPRKALDRGGNYLYAGPGRKPTLLKQLEGYVKTELHTVDTEEPQSQERKLQVYRNAFARFIEEFRTYRPLLGAIQKEYENTLVRLRDQIKELKPLRSGMRLVTEECDRKILARREDGQAQVRALAEERRRLLEDMEDMREQEERQKVVVSRLQRDLASQYLRYREEYDCRRLLLLKHSLCSCLAEEDGGVSCKHTYEEDEDPVKLKIALKVCRADLTKAQAELTRIQAEYWGVVPRRDWDALEDAHKRTLRQLQSLQGDFDQLKSEHDTLLEVHKRDSTQAKSDRSIAQQEGDGEEDGELLERVRKPSLDERQLDGKGQGSAADLTSVSPSLASAALDNTLSLEVQVNKEELDHNPPQLDSEIPLQRPAVSPMTGPLHQQD